MCLLRNGASDNERMKNCFFLLLNITFPFTDLLVQRIFRILFFSNDGVFKRQLLKKVPQLPVMLVAIRGPYSNEV